MAPPVTWSAEPRPRRARRAALREILHPLPEVVRPVVCGTIADCDDYADIAAWGAAHIGFLRKHLPCVHGGRASDG
jgi:hypothetical protein